MRYSYIFKSLRQSMYTLSAGLAFFTFSCTTQQEVAPENNQIPQAAINQLQSLGFDASEVKMDGENYIVEGDIEMSPAYLATMSAEQDYVVGPTGEHYRTRNLVSAGIYTVKGVGLTNKMSIGLKRAIRNYNDLNLDIKFIQIVAGDADITVTKEEGSAGGRAGFPFADGRPYNKIKLFSGLRKYDKGVHEHVVTHELGHCVGLRHVDYFNRKLSCGKGGNEGAGGSGAIHITGTPTGTDKKSVMEACFSSKQNGEFSKNDKKALRALY